MDKWCGSKVWLLFCNYIKTKKFNLFRNEENYFKYKSECLKAMLSLVEESGHPGGTKEYCQACQTACQPCSRQGQWIKFNRDAVNKNCYCNMTTCSFQDQGWQWMTIDTEKCSQNAIKDGLGNCIGLQMDRSSKSFEETDEDLEQSAFGRSGSSRIATYPFILLFLVFKQFILWTAKWKWLV